MHNSLNHLDEEQHKAVSAFSEWLVSSLSPTICGSKPSTVLTMTDIRFQPLLALWRTYGKQILTGSVIQFTVLYTSKDRETVLFYRPSILEQCLIHNLHRKFLLQFGYPVSSGLEPCLEVLQNRFQQCCPHEVGVLLGIPLKDVLGFMGLENLPLTCRGEWCVYGNPDESLAAMKQYADDRIYVDKLLANGIAPQEILGGKLAELALAI